MTHAQQITQLVTEALAALKLPVPSQIVAEHPAQRAFGDFSTNVAMVLYSELRTQAAARSPGADAAGLAPSFSQSHTEAPALVPTSPRALAEQIAAEIATRLTAEAGQWAFDKVVVAGSGFINFYYAQAGLAAYLREVIAAEGRMAPQLVAGQKAVVEYSSPNIAKPFTVGHLRSTIIGDAVANMFEAVGYTVFRDNHLGDWGTQFGKQIYALHHLGAGSLEANIRQLESSPNPVKDLVAMYIEFHEKAEADPALETAAQVWFKRLEDGDAEARRLWQLCVDWSWVEFEKIYARLGVVFSENHGRGYGEAFFNDKMGVVLEQLRAKKLLQLSQDAELFFFPDDKYPPLMIIKKDGASLYATRDLATDLFRRQHYGSDTLVVNEVGAEQSLYLKQVYEIEYILGWYARGQRVHVAHGLYRFKDRKMSTRKGNVIWLEEVLNEARDRALQLVQSHQTGSEQANLSQAEQQALAEAIGIAALKWNDLKRSAHLDVVFDWDEILNMQGNSGPYMQYAYVRVLAVLATARRQGMDVSDETLRVIANDFESLREINNAFKPEKEDFEVIVATERYYDSVKIAAQERAPHHLCTHLYNLAQAYNTWYAHHHIVDPAQPQLSQFRLAITRAVGLALAHGLTLLGIPLVQRM